MAFFADLHIHSKYSRATSRDADLEHMAFWARRKGVSVVGTGDFTHPEWLQEIEEKLVPAEPGLFRLRPDLEKEVDSWLSGPSGAPVRFLLEVEISTIYKKDDRTRKVHHLIYAPDLDKVRVFNERLSRIGNLASDGRPILGLDSRDLLEITLESGDGCYLIPAHIWTPWFAALGSKSGFDTIEHCYGDLADEIFAVETGLSSDPPMNARLSRLDRYTLVSNSDAHSPPKIGREACRFETEMDYFAMRHALETGEGYGGTVEFFAEEGKYHLDGHRKCGVRLTPEESRQTDGACPQCGKPLTLGVMHRVCELADREADEVPTDSVPFRSLVPLEEVLSEIQGVGPKSKAVQRKYDSLTSRLGSELFILDEAPREEIENADSPLVAEALMRMRAGQVLREPGFDGEYGTIRLFEKDELARRLGGGCQLDLFGGLDQKPELKSEPKRDSKREPKREPKSKTKRKRKDVSSRAAETSAPSPVAVTPSQGCLLDGLDPDQRRAAEITKGPLIIVAGPGTGKTRTLTHRLAHLIQQEGVRPDECLAITFTNRAADEMAERIHGLLDGDGAKVPVMTFHRLGLRILKEHGQRLDLPPDLRVASEQEAMELVMNAQSLSESKAKRALQHISKQKRAGRHADLVAESDELAQVAARYEEELRQRGWIDFDDLVALPVALLDENADLVEHYRARYRFVSIDEYQDIDQLQYALVRHLVPPEGHLCVIGDPDQSIYAFRGADVAYFREFASDYPSAQTVHLTRNYRSTRTIVDAALQMIAPESLVEDRTLCSETEGPEQIEIHGCASERAEAEFVVHTIERRIGGSTFFSLDSDRVEGYEGETLGFGDFAVLYRTEAQAEALVEALSRSGIPFQKRTHRPLAEVEAVQALGAAMSRDDRDVAVAISDRLKQAAREIREQYIDLDVYLPMLEAIALRHADDLSGFVSDLALGVDTDFWDPRAEGVSLLTLHAAKGLEFPVVFIVGCEDGIVPLRFDPEDDSGESEERRLFFVGMTRAEKSLVLTHAKRRAWRGKVRDRQRSPFLDAIEARLLAEKEHKSGKKRSPYKQLSLFE